MLLPLDHPNILPTSINVARRLPALRQINPSVSWRTERVIFEAMEPDPEERYQAARAERLAHSARRRFIPLPF